MLRIAFVDDDLEHLQLLKTYLQQYTTEKNMAVDVVEFYNGLDFVEDYHKNGKIDIVFLDIEMPHLDGFLAAKKIREIDSKLAIVFVTNMAKYAIKGYEVNAVDFMVKPVGYYVFADKLQKAISFVEQYKEKEIILDTGDLITKLTVSQILYVEKDKNYLCYHTSYAFYRVRGTIANALQALESEGFARCISGCLVNLRHVTQVSKDTVWVSNIALPLSRQQKSEFKTALIRYMSKGM